MARKEMTREAYSAEFESLAQYLKGDKSLGNFQSFWERPNDYQRWTMPENYWNIVKELPPLIAGANAHGKPEGSGKWVYGIAAPHLMEVIFGKELDAFVATMREFMEENWGAHFRSPTRAQEEAEARILAYRRYKEFEALLHANGVTQYETAFTDHGMSAAEVRKLEKLINDKAGAIEAERNPAPKESLFEAPKKGKYPRFDDTEYTQYISDLRSKYMGPLEEMTSFSGMSIASNHVEDMMQKLADFDYLEICATLGAQKAAPPADDYGTNKKFYEFLANLPKAVAKSFEESTAKDIHGAMETNLMLLASSEGGMRSEGIRNLRNLKKLLQWLPQKIPGLESAALMETTATVIKEYDSRWAAMSAGPLHEKYMGQIRFSSSRDLPLADEWPEAMNPVKESVFAHVFLDRALRDIAAGDMLFLEAGQERYRFSLKAIGNGDRAYVCLGVFPESGTNPDLIRTFGKALAAADGEVACVFTPITERSAVGTLRLKMTKADIGKLAERTEKLAAVADANRTAAAVLPEVFAKAQKWPYKDKVLSMENVRQAIEEAWEYDRKEKISIKHMRVNHFRPGWEWDVETDGLKRPIARLTFSYIGVIYEHDGRTYAVPDGIQLRQFWKGPGQGYSEGLNVLFWGANPFQLPPEQVKRIAK